MSKEIIKLGNFEFEKEHSIYKNHNTELVDKIKKMEPTDYFFLWNKLGRFKVDKVLNNTQTMCVNVDRGGEDEGGVQYEIINTSDIPELLRESNLAKINKTYPVQDYWLDNFGKIRTMHGEIVEVTGDLQFGSANRDFQYKDVSVRVHTWGTDTYNGFNYEESKEGYSCGFIFFNEDGNYVVRDYNQDLLEVGKYGIKMLTRDETVEKFLSEFDNFDTFEHVEGSSKWFTDEACYHILEQENYDWGLKLKVEMVIRRSPTGNIFFNQGESYRKIKKPKKGLIEVGPESIKSHLREIIEDYQKL